ncbi:MAG: flippase-like domain-containing protein [Actinomycetota bacterium]|nr:flippase-like domain-containing protein [Actinomycetota bacterium]
MLLVFLVVLVCSVAAWASIGSFRAGLTAAAAVNPRGAFAAGLAFVCSLVASAFAWRVGFGSVGARIGRLQACANYGVGSLVNTFVPARLGDVVRAGLFARTLPAGRGRALTAAGVVGAVEVCRAFVHAAVIVAAAGLGAVPLWPVLVLVGVALCALGTAVVTRRRGPTSRLAQLAEAAAAIVARPSLGLRILGWVAVAASARIAAAFLVCASLGVGSPLVAALVITAAMEIAGAFPITPGNVGITSGAISLALAGHGVALPTALAVGLVFHAIESAAGVSFGLASSSVVARPRLLQRPLVRFGAAVTAAAGLAVLGAAMLPDVG